MLRLYLRRDRIVAPLWILLLSVPLATVYVGGIETVYPTQAGPRRLRRHDHGQPRAAGAVREHLQRQPRGHRHLEGGDVPPADRCGRDPHRHPAHPRRRGNRSRRTDRLDRGRPLRGPDRRTAAVVRRVAAHRLRWGGGPAGYQRSRAGVAGVRRGAGLLRSGVHRGSRCDGATFDERTASPAGRRSACWRAAFTLRAVGDAGSSALSWFSPLGWSLQVRPYAGDRWWVLLLHLATTAAVDCARLPTAGRPRRRRRADRRATRPSGRNPVATQRLRPGLAPRPRRAGAVDRRTVPLRAADRQHRPRHRRRNRRRGRTRHRRPDRRQPGRGAGVHRGGVHHAGHDGRRVRHLADPATAPGGDRPAGRDPAERLDEPNPLAGKPSRVRTRRLGGGDRDRRRRRRADLWRRRRRCRRKAGRWSRAPRWRNCPRSGCSRR